MVHETVAGELHTLQSYWDMDVIKPVGDTTMTTVHLWGVCVFVVCVYVWCVCVSPSQEALPERSVVSGQF